MLALHAQCSKAALLEQRAFNGFIVHGSANEGTRQTSPAHRMLAPFPTYGVHSKTRCAKRSMDDARLVHESQRVSRPPHHLLHERRSPLRSKVGVPGVEELRTLCSPGKQWETRRSGKKNRRCGGIMCPTSDIFFFSLRWEAPTTIRRFLSQRCCIFHVCVCGTSDPSLRWVLSGKAPAKKQKGWGRLSPRPCRTLSRTTSALVRWKHNPFFGWRRSNSPTSSSRFGCALLSSPNESQS